MVMVIAGADKGRTGRVLRVLIDKNRVVVEGVNRVWKHVRPSQRNPQGGRLHKEMPLQMSNVQVVCPSCGKPSRMGSRIAKDGSKERFCRKCGGGLGQISPAPKAS